MLFNAVGDFSHNRFANGSPEKIALHALAGGLAAEAMGGDFRTGAMAAGANEALVEYLDSQLGSDPETRTHFLTTASQLVGIVAAELVNGDVHQGAEIAAQATRYNYLRHDQLAMARAELADCNGESHCMEEVVERYQDLSQEQHKAAVEACSTDLAACQEHSLAAANGEYARYGDDTLWDLPSVALPYMQALFDENIGVQNQFGEATIARSLMEGAGLAPSVAAGLAAAPWGVNKKTNFNFPLARPQANAQSNVILGALDHLGRPTGVTATITRDMIKTGGPANPSIRPPGFEGGANNHSRGHLLANVLGGSGNDARNLVTLFQRNTNSPNMRYFEAQVRNAVESGQAVNFRAVPVYTGGELVPTGVTLTARGSGGFDLSVSVPNIDGVSR
ncbi:DNA/RNA non-specific endonuclease [Billgrantia sp. Q4P2]|uniref:DNA/RNA non-specific endonuclease n=1 Tax=Billgrantia sp. Q4P2 TaxID=3463857 RepID=UPI004055AF34